MSCVFYIVYKNYTLKLEKLQLLIFSLYVSKYRFLSFVLSHSVHGAWHQNDLIIILTTSHNQIGVISGKSLNWGKKQKQWHYDYRPNQILSAYRID